MPPPSKPDTPPKIAPPPEPYIARRPSDPFEYRGGGSAWKVAYADFVTALMALFIVLWMMNSSRAVKMAVSGYFKDPRGYTQKLGAGPANAGESAAVHAGQIQHALEEALRRMPEFQLLRNNVHFSVTGEGLRIDLLENEQGLFFVTGSAEPTVEGERTLSLLAVELGRMGNPVVIEGHTDSRPFRNVEASRGYGNWDLSTDRANAARRLLHAYGMPPPQVVEVRGFADQKLLVPEEPGNPHNRRVSLVVKFSN